MLLPTSFVVMLRSRMCWRKTDSPMLRAMEGRHAGEKKATEKKRAQNALVIYKPLNNSSVLHVSNLSSVTNNEFSHRTAAKGLT